MSMFLILFLVSMLVSSIGFKKFVYFISLGYGFSVAIMAVVLFFTNLSNLTLAKGVLCVLLMLYGCRLGGYLLLREIKSANYRQTMKKEVKDGSDMKFFVKVIIWLSCCLLYVCQISPIMYRVVSQRADNVMSYVGIVVMILGMGLEALADQQKSKAKQKNPHRFVDTGLYKLVRCPNYLGEVLFWTGVLLSSLPVVSTTEFLIGLAGYICIVYIMFGGARRLEIRQNKNYGKDPEYQKYVKSTPILIPFIPLYSVEKYKWLVG